MVAASKTVSLRGQKAKLFLPVATFLSCNIPRAIHVKKGRLQLFFTLMHTAHLILNLDEVISIE